mmetsp:Transcript_36552/g.112619  ORF Transcript_36552/g.112619 Transcript_36552/m.112619 type:complete len:225 (+) Transcript_36552:5741-6415(+)
MRRAHVPWRVGQARVAHGPRHRHGGGADRRRCDRVDRRPRHQGGQGHGHVGVGGDRHRLLPRQQRDRQHEHLRHVGLRPADRRPVAGRAVHRDGRRRPLERRRGLEHGRRQRLRLQLRRRRRHAGQLRLDHRRRGGLLPEGVRLHRRRVVQHRPQVPDDGQPVPADAVRRRDDARRVQQGGQLLLRRRAADVRRQQAGPVHVAPGRRHLVHRPHGLQRRGQPMR